MSAKHTPGPWEDVGPNEEGERCIFGGDDSGVAVTIPVGNPDMNEARSIANARLIAAAPELLEAIKGVVRIADRNTVEFDAARAAIAKAEVA